MVLHLDEEQVDHFSFFITCILNKLLIVMNAGVDDAEAILNKLRTAQVPQAMVKEQKLVPQTIKT
jgi:hypothetical protein